MYVKWLDHLDLKNIYVNENTYRKWKEKIGNTVMIQYGTLTIPRKIKVKRDLPDENLSLSTKLTEDITLPMDVLYEVQIDKNQLIIGPLIGIMVSKYHKDLTNEKLELLKQRVKNYEKIKGVVFISTHDLMDKEKRQIQGFYYNRSGDWQEASFPIPKVIINRPYMKKALLKKLTMKDHISITQNCNMTKLKFWRLLSTHWDVHHYLPFTKKLEGIRTLLEMLNTFEVVYLKPSNLSRGRGIYRVQQGESGILIKGRHNKWQIKDHKELASFLDKLIKKHTYIIQQAVPYQVGDRMIDFRLYMQKDETLDWNSSGIFFRVSKRGKIVTNVKHCREIMTFEKGIKTFFSLTNEEKAELEEQINIIGKKICKALEERGQLISDVALDIVIDQDKQIWVLEVQVNYANDERLYQLPAEIYRKVWDTPLKYAKALLRLSETGGRSS